MVQSRDANEGRRAPVMQMGGRWQEEHQTFDRTAWVLPDGFTALKVSSAGNRTFDIYPYMVSDGAKGGAGRNKYCDPGFLHYERTFFVHYGIGPNEGAYVCPAMTCNKPCPICEYRNNCKDEKTSKALMPKERQLWYVLDHNERTKGKNGIQIWDYSFHLFGKMLKNYLDLSPLQLGYRDFAHPKNGKTLIVGFVEKALPGGKCYEAAVFNFTPRQPLSKEIVMGLPALDDLIIVKPYNELSDIFYQTVASENNGEAHDDADGDPAPAPQPGRRPAPQQQAPPPAATEDEWGNDDTTEPAPAATPPKAGRRPAAAPTAPPAVEPGDWDDPAENAAQAPQGADDEGWGDDAETPAPQASAPTPAKKSGGRKPAQPVPPADAEDEWNSPPPEQPAKPARGGGKKQTPAPAAPPAAEPDEWE